VNPELPFLAAGAIAVAGGTAKAKHFPPPHMTVAVIGTLVLVIIASASKDSKAAPVIHAIGLLMLLAAVMSAMPLLTKKVGKVK
jgi:hypothetical protein